MDIFWHCKGGYFSGTNRVKECRSGLRVQDGTKNGDGEVGEVFGAFIELQPANDAVIGQIFADSRFGNAEMLGEKRLDVDARTAIGAAASHVGDRDAQRVASFDVIVSGHIVIGENEDAGASGSAISLIEFHRRACKQPAKLHFEERKA